MQGSLKKTLKFEYNHIFFDHETTIQVRFIQHIEFLLTQLN